MKKITIFALTLLLMLSFSVTSFAASSTPDALSLTDPTIAYLDNGDYIITSFTFSENFVNSQRSTNTITKTGTKTVSYYNDDNELEWEYHLTGTFTVNPGVSAICTNASHSTSIYSSKWSFSDANTYTENNVAHGQGLFKKKVLLIAVKKVNIDVCITCDINGNFTS